MDLPDASVPAIPKLVSVHSRFAPPRPPPHSGIPALQRLSISVVEFRFCPSLFPPFSPVNPRSLRNPRFNPPPPLLFPPCPSVCICCFIFLFHLRLSPFFNILLNHP